MSYTLSLAACGLPEYPVTAAKKRMKADLEAQLGGPRQVLDASNAYRYSSDEKPAISGKAPCRVRSRACSPAGAPSTLRVRPRPCPASWTCGSRSIRLRLSPQAIAAAWAAW